MAGFVTQAVPPAEARLRATAALLDTVGVTLAGAAEPASRIVQRAVLAHADGPCTVLGTAARASAEQAALANGTAAHALDFDDMCFVSLAHPSAPLVPALLAAADLAGATGRAVLDAYVVGFEIETRFGRAMNPRHYQRGWHCTSTLGILGAAAGVSRLLGLDAAATGHAIGIAASAASGLKENFGTMVKPLHAGLAASHGVLAARLAQAGMSASAAAIDGPQGFLHAMDSEQESLAGVLEDLGARWDVLDTGITVKLYPSCAGTHPALDAVLDLRREAPFTAGDVEAIDIGVDPNTPTVLLYDRPSSGLEAKFSMPYCVAAAVVHGRVGLDTFDDATVRDGSLLALMSRISMRVDPGLDRSAAPLTQARVSVRLRDGRVLSRAADGARGYPTRPASDVDLDAKFVSCAARSLPAAQAARLLGQLHDFGASADVRTVTALMSVR
jgi:2-methylcitrate dehydratase PrpD